MKHGFIKAAAITPDVCVADVGQNVVNICRYMDEAVAEHVKVVVFPELCITGYTCQDLFLQDELLEEAKEALHVLADHSRGLDALFLWDYRMPSTESFTIWQWRSTTDGFWA